MSTLVKDTRFELVTEILKPDAKKRLTLGQAMAQAGVAYNVYRNRLGQIMLDPVKAVPAYEAWLFENKPALASVKRGLAQSAAGRTKKRGSFAADANDEQGYRFDSRWRPVTRGPAGTNPERGRE
jgi:hypothetical protein